MSAFFCVRYTQNHYDRRGRVVRQELETGEEFVIFYDDAARQNTFLTGSTGENVVYSYGREKLPTQVLYHDGTTECYRYDSGRNTIYEKDRLGRETTRLYNETGQPTEEHFPDGYARYTEYDGRGLATRIYDNAGREVANTYDECGNLVKSGRRMDGNTVLETAFSHDVHWSTKIGHLNCIFLHTIRNYCTVAYVSLYCLGVRYPSAYAGLSSLKNFIYASISSGTFSPCR